MAAALAHAVFAAPAATSSSRAAPRCSLRCFTAAVRGQQLQQRAAVRAQQQRAVVVTRATAEPEETEEEEEEDFFQERVVQVRCVELWRRAGGGASGGGTLQGPLLPACGCPAQHCHAAA